MIAPLRASEERDFARHASTAWNEHAELLRTLGRLSWGRDLADSERVRGLALLMGMSDAIFEDVEATGAPVEDAGWYHELMAVLARYVLLATQPPQA